MTCNRLYKENKKKNSNARKYVEFRVQLSKESS